MFAVTRYEDATSGRLTMNMWLSDLKMPQYAPAFQAAGVANLNALSHLTDADLDAVQQAHTSKLPLRHRTKLLAASQKLAQRRHELYQVKIWNICINSNLLVSAGYAQFGRDKQKVMHIP